MNKAQQDKLDQYVLEYLRYRGFNDLAEQFKVAVQQPDIFQDPGQTSQLLMGLALAGNTSEVISKTQLFIDAFIANTPQIVQAGNQM